MIKESCIYTGKVVHKRFKPKEHFFKYKVFSILLDLNETKQIIKLHIPEGLIELNFE